jgi:hypothetical protein
LRREADVQHRTDLLVVAQVMAGLRYPGLDLLTIFGGRKAMIESPLILKVRAEAQHEGILDLLKDRFDKVPRDVAQGVAKIIETKKLRKLILLAAKCRDMEAFREGLLD